MTERGDWNMILKKVSDSMLELTKDTAYYTELESEIVCTSHTTSIGADVFEYDSERIKYIKRNTVTDLHEDVDMLSSNIINDVGLIYFDMENKQSRVAVANALKPYIEKLMSTMNNTPIGYDENLFIGAPLFIVFVCAMGGLLWPTDNVVVKMLSMIAGLTSFLVMQSLEDRYSCLEAERKVALARDMDAIDRRLIIFIESDITMEESKS